MASMMAYSAASTNVAALPQRSSTYGLVALLWLALVAFAVLGGADFGAGFWDFFSFGRPAEQERGAFIHAIGPIWEANEIWLIFLITGLFTAFPLIFATLSVALFIPAVLALIGIVLRGAAFVYYSHLTRLRPDAPVRIGLGRTFGIASVIAPFFFGVMAGAVAGGHIHVQNGAVILNSPGSYISIWLAPFPLVCGCYAVAMCALLAAVYMTVEAHNSGNRRLVVLFRHRAFIAFAAIGVLGLVAGLLGAIDAPDLWANVTSRALPLAFALTSVVVGIAALVFLVVGRYLLARVAVAGTVGGILLTWGAAQYPYLVPPDLTITNAAAPPSVMGPLLVSSVVGMMLILPSFWFLLSLFKAQHRSVPHPSAEAYATTALPSSDQTSPRTGRSLESSASFIPPAPLESRQPAWTWRPAAIAAGMLVLLVIAVAWWLAQRRKTGFS